MIWLLVIWTALILIWSVADAARDARAGRARGDGQDRPQGAGPRPTATPGI